MSLKPCTVFEAETPVAPLVVDSPHSGRIYPSDFSFTCPFPLLRQTEDSYVDELVVVAQQAGATVVAAEFPRSYIDANRAEDDLDPAVLAGTWDGVLNPTPRTLQGLGLVRRLCKSGVPVYSAPLPVMEVQKRIHAFYRPYHETVQRVIARRLADFGECYLINAHSMPNQSAENRGSSRPDFVLGDRNGTSCDPSFTRRVHGLLQDMGYSVALNDPYKGVEIVRRYGQPQKGQHALQLEINRKLYMDETSLEKHHGFVKLRNDLAAFFAALAMELARELPDRVAAE